MDHLCATMEDSVSPPATPSFPGFQSSVHRDDMEYERVLTRLQRRAPAPLPLDQLAVDNKQIIFPTGAVDYHSPQTCPARFGSSSGSGSFKKGGGGGGKQDPIPLLTPLVSPTTAGLGQQKQGISSLCFVRHGD
ncbi:hypothetical protein LINGRAHAP2_LOCUS18363 [Linum grandiflorum]